VAALPGAPAGIRCNIGEHVSPRRTHAGYFLGRESRLGLTPAELEALAGDRRIRGLHLYLGTDLTDLSYFEECYRALVQLSRHFPALDYLDFGGGFGVPGQEGRFDMEAYGRSVTGLMEEACALMGRRVRLILEPGRLVGAESGYFVCRVTDVKERDGLQLVGVNASAAQFPRPLFYPEEARHPVALLPAQDGSPASACPPPSTAAPPTRATTSPGHPAAPARMGDLVVFGDAGSYCASAHTAFSASPRRRALPVIRLEPATSPALLARSTSFPGRCTGACPSTAPRGRAGPLARLAEVALLPARRLEPFVALDGERPVARFALVNDARRPEYAQVAFFEALPGATGLLEAILPRAREQLPGCTRLVPGSMATSTTARAFWPATSRSRPSSACRTPRRTTWTTSAASRARTWSASASRPPPSTSGSRGCAPAPAASLPRPRPRHLAREVAIYTHLNNACFQQHPYWADRTPEEDLELFQPFRFFLDDGNLIFAERDGTPVGFLLWLPRLQRAGRPRGAAGAAAPLALPRPGQARREADPHHAADGDRHPARAARGVVAAG